MSTTNGTVRIIGDRQTGKTELLMYIAMRGLAEGKRVLYVAEHPQCAHEAFLRLEQLTPDHLVERAYRTNGQQRIRAVSGGTVHFRSLGRSGTPVNPDILLLDAVSTDVEFSYPDVKVYRTSL